MQISQTHRVYMLYDILDWLHRTPDARQEVFLELFFDVGPAVQSQHDLGPLEGHPGTDDLHLDASHLVLDRLLLLYQSLAQSQ